jgi:hypothetical protein
LHISHNNIINAVKLRIILWVLYVPWRRDVRIYAKFCRKSWKENTIYESSYRGADTTEINLSVVGSDVENIELT